MRTSADIANLLVVSRDLGVLRSLSTIKASTCWRFETASDTWGYSRQMIVNPLTNEKHGLMVYFAEGIVQSVDYDRNGGTQ